MSAATAKTAATTEASASAEAAAASEASTAATAASVSRVHGNPDDEKGCENSKANELEPHHDNLKAWMGGPIEKRKCRAGRGARALSR